jgi:polyferredoxin
VTFRRVAPQIVRHGLQLFVLAFIIYAAFGGTWRNYKLAHNQQRIVSLIQGEFWGQLYGANEDLLALGGDPFDVSLGFLGFPWSSRVFGIDSVDPILAIDQFFSVGSLPGPVLLGLVMPVALALVLGRFFCSHLCPMRLLFDIGRRVRSGLLRIGVPLPELRSPHRLGGYVLVGGLLASAAASSAVWLFILPYVSFSAGLFLLITAGTGGALLATAGGWFLIDALAAPGLFCHNLCPTGFLLEQLGRLSVWRVRKTTDARCPTNCALCSDACPYALTPEKDERDSACDGCGLCVVACPTKRLSRRFVLPLAGIAAVCVLPMIPKPAHAHHNKGIPHYGYFENYPQVPTEEYVGISDRWEISATLFNFQGLDRRNSDTPNDVKIYLAIYDLEADAGYTGPLDVEIYRGDEIVSRFERVRVDEEAVYSTRETFPATDDYELVVHTADAVIRLPIRVDLASDAVNWWWIIGIALPVGVVFALALAAGNRKHRTRTDRTARGAAVGAALLFCLVTTPSAEAEDTHAHHASAAGRDNHTNAHANAHPDGDSGMVMVMAGLPLPLFLGGIGGVIALSFVATEWMLPTGRRKRRFNLIRNRRVYRAFRNRWFQAVPQLMTTAALLFLIYAGLFGSRVSNITPVAVWTFWWGGLIFSVLLLGSAWCFVCPWDGMANWISRLRVVARTETLSLGLPFPKWLEGVTPAIVLFAGLVWLELGTDMVRDPRTTAYLGLAMAGMAITSALLWDGKRFCAHLCPVGRICGAYANFSPIEIRARNPRTCEVCTTQDCLHGNDKGYACPVGISLATVEDASDCTMCTECIKSCDKHNVALNLRPFGADLRAREKPRMDLAWLIVALLALTLFHGLTMTDFFESFEPGRQSVLKWMELRLGTPSIVNFSAAMAVAVAIPTGLFWSCCQISTGWAGSGGGSAVDVRKAFANYALSLLPIALFYHLAHNLMHLVMEGGAVVGLLSDPMGRGLDLFGTRGLHPASPVSHETLWVAQVVLILIGHVIGIVVAHRISRSLYPDRKRATRSVIPFAVLTILISVFGLWLMHLDMNMRIGRM